MGHALIAALAAEPGSVMVPVDMENASIRYIALQCSLQWPSSSQAYWASPTSYAYPSRCFVAGADEGQAPMMSARESTRATQRARFSLPSPCIGRSAPAA